MNSMTGYGRGQYANKGIRAVVEISSVNRRQSDITVFIPSELELVESRIRDRVNEYVSRGKVTVRVSLEIGERAWSGKVRFNRSLAKTYAAELSLLAKQLGLTAPLNIECVIRLPGVVAPPSATNDPEAIWPLIDKALSRALKSLAAMRAREGAHLARDLAARVRRLRQLSRQISARAPKLPALYKEALLNRMKAAGITAVNTHDERLLKEIVLFTDRSDISEELTRLEGHFKQCDECFRSTAPVGRTLDFLAQEINREINTIGSKANDALISRAVVEFKAELERFREQVQNVE
ncbi:MAG TPA: YicC family protein [Verrucomicrobiota bacterium]|nr:YicC family protein [Verrucomicrobiota bacterium]